MNPALIRPVLSRCGALLALLVLAALNADAAGWPRSSIYPPKPELAELPLKVVDKLVVNAANLERTVAYGKCEEQGIREIYALLQSARYEEMWAFAPGPRAADCRWYEVGRDIEENVEGTSVRIDRPFLAELIFAHDELHLYHFHPLHYFERCPTAARCGKLGLPRSAGQISAAGLTSNLRYAMPSPEDIYFMMDMSWLLKRRRGDSARMRHRVITPYGMVDYALTAEGQERYDYDRNLRTGGLYIALVAGNALVDDAINEIVARHPQDVDQALRYLTQTLNSRHLRVIYTPFLGRK